MDCYPSVSTISILDRWWRWSWARGTMSCLHLFLFCFLVLFVWTDSIAQLDWRREGWLLKAGCHLFNFSSWSVIFLLAGSNYTRWSGESVGLEGQYCLIQRFPKMKPLFIGDWDSVDIFLAGHSFFLVSVMFDGAAFRNHWEAEDDHDIVDEFNLHS